MKLTIEKDYDDENRLIFHLSDAEIPEKLTFEDINPAATSEFTMFQGESAETYHFLTTLLSIDGVVAIERNDDRVVITKREEFAWKDLVEDILHVLKTILKKPGDDFEVSPYCFY